MTLTLNNNLVKTGKLSNGIGNQLHKYFSEVADFSHLVVLGLELRGVGDRFRISFRSYLSKIPTYNSHFLLSRSGI